MQKQTRGGRKSGVIVCAWCSRYLGTIQGAELVSHGICLDCKTRELARLGVRKPLAGGRSAHPGGPPLIGVRIGERSGHP